AKALADRIDDLRVLSPRGASVLDPTGIERSIATIEVEDDAEVASAIARTEVRPALIEIVDLATGIRDGAASRIAAERSWAGTLAQLTSWSVALLIPMAALLVYRLVARRDLQAARLEERLAREREIVSTKDQFLSNLSHELKTPLTSILGFTLAVDDSFEDPNTVDFSVLSEVNDLVLADAAKLTRMIEDLLVIDKADDQLGLVPETAPISWLIDESLDTFRRTGLDIAAEGDMEPVNADPEAVKHILRNLIANATAHGSPPVRVVGKLVGDSYFVEVRDRGSGVAEHRLETLFQRYVHDADQPLIEGSVGLGTAVAQKLAVAIGGGISYHREGDETVFSLQLPHVTIPNENVA
ncbi:MAG: HAMP domain-containing histidine kinase, partial [Acidimicrobiia bacterium]|nr:HAMP domain-containing histidine kinase [Acidimicrobiia bacterium]